MPCGAIRATTAGLLEPPIFKYEYISTKLSGIWVYTLANINVQLFFYFFLEKCHNEVKKTIWAGLLEPLNFK